MRDARHRLSDLCAKFPLEVRSAQLVNPTGKLPVIIAATELSETVQKAASGIAFAFQAEMTAPARKSDFRVDNPTDGIIWFRRPGQDIHQPLVQNLFRLLRRLGPSGIGPAT